MTRFLLSIVLGVSTALGLLLPLPLGEAAGVAKTLAQTPVTGRLADGGTFQGRLTLQALRFDEAGATRRDRRPGGHGHARCGPHDEGASAHVYHPRGVAGPAGHLQDPRRGSGAAHRGPARAGTHAGARGPGSRDRAARRSAGCRGRSVPWRASRSNAHLSPRQATSRERRPVRTAWSMRACARAGPPGAWDAIPCLPCRPRPACPPSQNERTGMVLHQSSASEQRACRVPL